jgi:hypothetical protein
VKLLKGRKKLAG